MNDPVISLDTNIVIVGLRFAHTSEERIIDNLFRFRVKLARQVEKELRRNLTDAELKRFYHRVQPFVTVDPGGQNFPADIVERYRAKGLKKGDLRIAAFCEWQGIDIFVSENRHFLYELPDPPFQVMDADDFCLQFVTPLEDLEL